MCGLAGVFYGRPMPPSRVGPNLCAAMARSLRHRGPDDMSYEIEEASGLAMTFARLAILDVTDAGRQPMRSPSGRFLATFNGEIYNFAELRLELGERGIAVAGASDTAVLVALFDAVGVDVAIPKLLGMFAIAVWDREAATLTLARDRLGKKPLYVARLRGGGVAFGSELRALACSPDFTDAVDAHAFSQFLRYGYVPDRHAIFEGSEKVQPGEILHFREGAIVGRMRFWSLPDAVQNAMEAVDGGDENDDDDLLDELDKLLRDAVRRRLVADVPVGALLSGGVDSSLISAIAQEESPGRVRTFSIGFDEPAYDESVWAEKIASHLGTDHETIMLRAEDSRMLATEMGDLYDEPFADSSQLATTFVARAARKHVTVALSGDGGDEAFGGYERHRQLLEVDRVARRTPRWARVLAARALQSAPRMSATALRLAPPMAAAMGCAALSGRNATELRRFSFLLGEFNEGLDRAAFYHRRLQTYRGPTSLAHRPSDSSQLDVVEDAFARFDHPLTAMQAADCLTYLPGDNLAKVDRASMACGLEVRSPLLDHRVVVWSLSRPVQFRRRDGVAKRPLQALLERRTPPALVRRPKQGFAVPVKHWLKTSLREWAETLIEPQRLASEGHFNPSAVATLWSDHLAGRANNFPVLWSILMFQSWLEARRR